MKYKQCGENLYSDFTIKKYNDCFDEHLFFTYYVLSKYRRMEFYVHTGYEFLDSTSD